MWKNLTHRAGTRRESWRTAFARPVNRLEFLVLLLLFADRAWHGCCSPRDNNGFSLETGDKTQEVCLDWKGPILKIKIRYLGIEAIR